MLPPAKMFGGYRFTAADSKTTLDRLMYKYELKKINSIIIIIILLPLSLLFLNPSDEEAVASSPAYELQE